MTSQSFANACGFVFSLSMLSPKFSRSADIAVVKSDRETGGEVARDEGLALAPKKLVMEEERIREHSTTTIVDTKDIQNHARTFWLIRILYVSYYASTGSLVPYLSVYYRFLGHSGHIIGILSALRPFINVLVGPLWGMMADYTGDTLGMLRIAAFFSMLGYIATGVYNDVASLVASVIFTSIFYAPVRSLMDSFVLEQLAEMAHDEKDDNDNNKQQPERKKHGTEQFGRLRLWGPIGYGLGCSLAGMIVTRQITKTDTNIDKFMTVPVQTALLQTEVSFARSLQNMTLRNLIVLWNSMTGYKILFGIFAAMSMPMMATLWSFPSKPKPGAAATKEEPAKGSSNTDENKGAGMTRILRGLSTVLHDQDALVFFFLVFVIGINYGGIETFCYVRMREVGATGQQIGMSRLVCALSGTPMFWLSGHLKRWFKAEQVLVLGLMAFTARFVVYALIRTPLDALPAESIRGIAFAAFYSTASTYVHQLSPPGLNSTMLMLMNALHGGFGQSVGSILAGKLQSQIGTSQTFLWMAYMNAVFIIFIVLYLNYFRGLNIVGKIKKATGF